MGGSKVDSGLILSWSLKWILGTPRILAARSKLYPLRGESHIDFFTQSVIMTLKAPEGGGRLSLMVFWDLENLSNFKAHELSWTVNLLCTRILRLPSSCPPIAHIHTSTEKIILLLSLAPKWNASKKTKTTTKKKQTHTSNKTTEIKNIKLWYSIIILNIQLYLNLLFFKM